MPYEAGSVVINITIDTSEVNAGMENVRRNINGSLNTFNKNIRGFTTNFRKIARPVLEVAKWYMTAVTGLAAKALHSLAMDNSVMGRAWKKTFDVFRMRMNMEMARIGSLLLKTPLFGKTIPAWMDKLVDVLKKVDLSKVERLVKLFEKAAIAVVAIKGIIGVSSALSGLTGLGKIAGLGAGAQVATTAASAGIGASIGTAGMDVFTKRVFEHILPMAKGGINNIRNMLRHTIAEFENKLSLRVGFPNIPQVGGTVGNQAQIWSRLPPHLPLSEQIKGSWVGKAWNKGQTPVSLPEGLGGNLMKLGGKLIIITVAIEMVAGILKRSGFDIKDGIDLMVRSFEFVVGVFKTIGATLRWVAGNFTSVISLLVKALTFAFISIKDIFTLGLGQASENYVRNMAESWRQFKSEMLTGWDDYGKELVDIASKAGGYEGTKINPKGTSSKDMLSEMLGPKESFAGQYIGISESAKFQQSVQQKGNDYLKAIAKSSQTLVDLAKGNGTQD
jgi:hypothetical protein